MTHHNEVLADLNRKFMALSTFCPFCSDKVKYNVSNFLKKCDQIYKLAKNVIKTTTIQKQQTAWATLHQTYWSSNKLNNVTNLRFGHFCGYNLKETPKIKE